MNYSLQPPNKKVKVERFRDRLIFEFSAYVNNYPTIYIVGAILFAAIPVGKFIYILGWQSVAVLATVLNDSNLWFLILFIAPIWLITSVLIYLVLYLFFCKEIVKFTPHNFIIQTYIFNFKSKQFKGATENINSVEVILKKRSPRWKSYYSCIIREGRKKHYIGHLKTKPENEWLKAEILKYLASLNSINLEKS